MPTLEDLAGAIDSAVEASVPQVAQLQADITQAIGLSTGLSVEAIYGTQTTLASTEEVLYQMAIALRSLMIENSKTKYMDKALTAAQAAIIAAQDGSQGNSGLNPP